ncbi:hypothetical protein VIGAN_UM148900 [Vigna angularis var. angularis]|uniref:RNase III domain-containing protein n=1 Tax=Vigna angularis var. angularis TaxID=157739 RepID=A0A0S3TEW0_PHAAN|nr:hypothetical protein VIGAN_UM148900 [Vigna angularis var. angularis]
MEASVIEVERILSYGFIDGKLLEEALTHSSSTAKRSWHELPSIAASTVSSAKASHLCSGMRSECHPREIPRWDTRWIRGAPKVLSDIVESVAAAVYFDLGFDLEKFWEKVVGEGARLKVVGEGASCPTKKWQQQLVGGGSFHFEVLQPPGNIIIIFLMDTALRNGRGRLRFVQLAPVHGSSFPLREEPMG